VSTSTNNTFEITVNVPTGADKASAGQALVDALVAWQRRNGAVPITTR